MIGPRELKGEKAERLEICRARCPSQMHVSRFVGMRSTVQREKKLINSLSRPVLEWFVSPNGWSGWSISPSIFLPLFLHVDSSSTLPPHGFSTSATKLRPMDNMMGGQYCRRGRKGRKKCPSRVTSARHNAHPRLEHIFSFRRTKSVSGVAPHRLIYWSRNLDSVE